MHFGENQLSRSLIGLSPLPTDHPPGFQPWWVRSSTTSYSRFNLPMGRSPRFGSAAYDYNHPKRGGNALFGLAFATAPPHGLTSPHTTTRRLILQKAHHHTLKPRQHKDWREHALMACRRTVSGTLSQPLTGALFTFPSRYSCTIGHREVFRLTRWSWQIHTRFHEPRATRDTPKRRPCGFTYRTITVYGHPSQSVRLPHNFLTPHQAGGPDTDAPTTPNTQPPPGITRARFSLIPFRSPLLRESHIVFFSYGY